MSEIASKANIAKLQEKITKDDLRDQAAQIGRAVEEIEDIRANRGLRKGMTWFLIIQFTVVNLAVVSLFFMNGLGHTTLSDTALVSLLGSTVGELAAIIFVVTRYLFPVNRA